MTSKEIRKAWGRRLLDARRRNGWTVFLVAQLVDVQPSTVSRWERGLTTITDEHKVRLAGIYRRPLADLFPWPAEVPPVPRAKPVRKVAA